MYRSMYGFVLLIVVALILSACGFIGDGQEVNDASKISKVQIPEPETAYGAITKEEDTNNEFSDDETASNTTTSNERANDKSTNNVKDDTVHVSKDVPKPQRIQFVEAFGGESFDTPVGVVHAGDGSGRLFIIEQPGSIRVLSGNMDKPSNEQFINLRDKVYSRGNEQGLLGLAFHPDFKSNGKFYVNYTTREETVIASYTTKSDSSGVGDPLSGEILLAFDQPFNNHNGGALAFGADGYLYIASGDGGSGGDPHGNGQNLKTLLGKMLRIDVDHSTGEHKYAIPKDNPFYQNKNGAREEIYAYGLRNPWRFSFDRQTGKLWAADVGQSSLEEIDIIENGHNYGWNTMEGTNCYKPARGCSQKGITAPIWEYKPESGGASITGGYVYRGEQIPSLVGKYIFADFVDGRIWTLSLDESNKPTVEKLDLELFNITSFGEDEAGEIYASLYGGQIMRLSATAK